MPLVFVHGVNNRKGDADYDKRVERTDTFLNTIFAPRLNPAVGKLSTFYPYWGDEGVRFRWDQASLPKQSETAEALSAKGGAGDRELWQADVRTRHGKDFNLAAVSQNEGFEAAVDLVFDTAALSGEVGRTDQELATAYQNAQAYVEANPAPSWAMKPQDNDTWLASFRRELAAAARPAGTAAEALGVGDVWEDVKESARRFFNSGSDQATAVGVALLRKRMQTSAGRFLGDIFIYLDKRGTPDKPGPIIQRVVEQLDKAVAAKTAEDNRLIILSHSLGGAIVYDVLTYFRPDLVVDAWLTVGSQVALFEEMTLYRVSDANIPPNPPAGKVPAPPKVKRWVNVYDTNDVFSYRAEPVFTGVKDYRYDTGFGVEAAHGGYFAQPSFYKRLAARLA